MRPFSKRKSENLKKLLRNTLARFISLSNCAVNHIKILADALHAFVKVPADFLTRCGKRLAVGFLPRGKGAVPLGGGTVCRHIFKRDNLHLCGAGNATRLHIAVQYDRVITRARQQLHLGFKQAEQPCVGAFFAAKNVVQNFIGAVAVIKTDIVGRNRQPRILYKFLNLIHRTLSRKIIKAQLPVTARALQ